MISAGFLTLCSGRFSAYGRQGCGGRPVGNLSSKRRESAPLPSHGRGPGFESPRLHHCSAGGATCLREQMKSFHIIA
jgi:hypothetical protein